MPASRDYEGGFGSALMEKDLTLALGAANTIKVSLNPSLSLILSQSLWSKIED